MTCVVQNRARAAIIRSQPITGLTPDVIAELVAEIGPLWHERRQAVLTARPRRRAVGAGAKHKLVFVDRLLATLVHLRHGATHDVLAGWFDADRSTNPPEWYEEMYERQRKAHSSRHIRVEHGIGHLKNWRSLARHHGRREHMSDIIQAVAGLLSHQQTATMASGTRK